MGFRIGYLLLSKALEQPELSERWIMEAHGGKR